MTSTLPRRTAAMTALAVAAFSGVALVGAGAASASPKAHTSLSIRAVKSGINPGGSDQITGDLRARHGHAAGRWIQLLAKPTGTTTWTKSAVHRSGRNGNVGFEITPTATTRYRLAFAGNKFQHASRSGVVVVRVRSNTTSLTISPASKSIQPGASDTVNGVLSLDGTPLVGDTVDLLGAKGNHSLKQIGSAVTAADGSVTFSVTPPVTSRYALVFRKTATNAGARSAVVKVHVLMPSSLSIRARLNKKTTTEVITGDLRGGGSGLRHRKVTLQDRSSGSTTWTTVATKWTGKGGGVGFKEPAPTSNEDYQLVFAGGPIFDGCQSGVVTATVAA
jgi:hypothetical protein